MESLVMNVNFWYGKRVLVTGNTGFKGSWLSLWLQSLGAEVIGYALAPNTKPSLYEIANVSDGMTTILGDVRDLEKLNAVFSQFKPEIVIHMAAQALVRFSYDDPVETYSTNVMGTVNILEAVRQSKTVRAVVNVTSDKCYENQEWEWGYRENEAMGGYDPYSNSKGCSELITSSYRRSFFNPQKYNEHKVALASARAGNVIGGGDWSQDRLIPDIMRAIQKGSDVLIRNPHSIRPWQHVLEPLSGYLLLAEKLYECSGQYSEAWNFGPNDNDAKPVQFIVESLIEYWGREASWVLDGVEHPHEASYLKLDCSKAKARLNWQPKWDIDRTLKEVVDWYQAYVDGRDMKQLTLEQIEKYQRN
jgi:CDP-glucose 4,6-dehydratase